MLVVKKCSDAESVEQVRILLLTFSERMFDLFNPAILAGL